MCPRPIKLRPKISHGLIASKFFQLLVFGWIAVIGVKAQTTLYWDTNGASPGSGGPSANGTWATGNSAAAQHWSTDPNGTSASVGWNPNNIAVFSAGTDATGTYTV